MAQSHFRFRWRRGAVFSALLLSLASARCSSPDPTYYTLQPEPGMVRPAAAYTIEVRRPGLAGYLDRSDIVLKDAGYKLAVNSQERWAEPLGDMIGRVLTQDLAQRLPASSIFSESGAITADPALRVEVDIDRFDAEQDGAVTLVASVAIEAGATHHPLRARTVTLSATPAGGAANLAAAMSGLLGGLADRLAQDVAEVGPMETAAR